MKRSLAALLVVLLGSALVSCGSRQAETNVRNVDVWVQSVPALAGAKVRQRHDGFPTKSVFVSGEARVATAEEFFDLIEQMAQRKEEIWPVLTAEVDGTRLRWEGSAAAAGAGAFASLAQPGVRAVTTSDRGFRVQADAMDPQYLDMAIATLASILDGAVDLGSFFDAHLELGQMELLWEVNDFTDGAASSMDQARRMLQQAPTRSSEITGAEFKNGRLRELKVKSAEVDDAELIAIRDFLAASGMVDDSGVKLTVHDVAANEWGSAVVGGASSVDAKSELDEMLRELLEAP